MSPLPAEPEILLDVRSDVPRGSSLIHQYGLQDWFLKINPNGRYSLVCTKMMSSLCIYCFADAKSSSWAMQTLFRGVN